MGKDCPRLSLELIVGRDTSMVLAGMDGALHVRLEAAVSNRIERAAELSAIDQ